MLTIIILGSDSNKRSERRKSGGRCEVCVAADQMTLSLLQFLNSSAPAGARPAHCRYLDARAVYPASIEDGEGGMAGNGERHTTSFTPWQRHSGFA